ncbi:hypothetical protein [Shimia biformata]|uniref:hypothetical protein n=1 Tax=Shimia biformata TaxID=1294299 RepID=UPI00195077E7|nr:hypothetical protein [Shimia biformata]
MTQRAVNVIEQALSPEAMRAFLASGSDNRDQPPLVARIMTRANLRPAAMALRAQLSAAEAGLRGLRDHGERSEQLRLIADLRQRLAREQRTDALVA